MALTGTLLRKGKEMERYIAHIIRSAERRVDHFLTTQVNMPGNRMDGGMVSDDVVDVKPTVYVLANAVALYLNPDSRYYKSEKLMRAMDRAMDFVARNQRENGTVDYTCCNFYSAPDTSFSFKRLIAAYRLLVKFEDRADTAVLQQKYLAVMRRAAEGIRDGGFHTPNHRWGICAALLQAANLFAGEKEFAQSLKDRAAQYLNEGIDGSKDGEYAERSTGNYNAVVNNAMMAVYQETGDSEYLGYVERNLCMMQTYIEPDDTVFTQNSTRQDQGKRMYMDKYFYQYLYMAECPFVPEERRAEFDAAAHKIICDNMERGDEAPDCLHILMRHDEMYSHHFTHYGFLTTCRKYYEDAGVLRVKKENYAYTVMRGKSDFLYFNIKGMELYVKIGESYCEIRNFIPTHLEVSEHGCELSARANGWYYLPWKEKPDTSDWWKMDNSKRERLISSVLDTVVSIEELEDGISLRVHTEGIDHLPLRLEICIPAGTVVDNSHFSLEASAGQGMILRDDMAELSGNDRIVAFGPGFGEHEFKGHYSGEEKNTAGYTIFCNAYTPVEKTVTIRVKR